MRRMTTTLVVMIIGIGSSFAAEHVSCPQFVSLDAAQQVMFTKGFLGGLGGTLGVLDSAVRAVTKVATDPNQVKGAELVAAGVKKMLSGEAGDSDESFARSIATLCAQPKYATRPAASAAIDLLSGTKP
jgi:hypothetical protein